MPHTDTLWMDYGLGTDLQVWAIETAAYDNEVVADYKENHQVSFPFFSTMSGFGNEFLLDSFPITHTPWFYVICPDRLLRHIAFEDIRAYVNACTNISIKDIQFEELNCYYSNSRLYFDGNVENTTWDLSIYNISGKQVLKRRILTKQNQKSIPFKPSKGVYLISLTNKQEGRFVRKIIVY